MKKIVLIFTALFFSSYIFAQQHEIENEGEEPSQSQITETEVVEVKSNHTNPFKGVFLTYNQGVAMIQVTRIQKGASTNYSNHSNYIWNDGMVGLYSTIQSHNFPLCNWLFRYQVMYPFNHQFNGMEQIPKQTILYAFDFFLGMPFQFKSYKYININLTPGLHGMYQLSDEYHLGYFGAGVILGLEFPITSRWTVITDGTYTFDYANLGSNKLIQKFDYSWQWQASLGFRYSRRKLNTYSYLGKTLEQNNIE